MVRPASAARCLPLLLSVQPFLLTVLPHLLTFLPLLQLFCLICSPLRVCSVSAASLPASATLCPASSAFCTAFSVHCPSLSPHFPSYSATALPPDHRIKEDLFSLCCLPSSLCYSLSCLFCFQYTFSALGPASPPHYTEFFSLSCLSGFLCSQSWLAVLSTHQLTVRVQPLEFVVFSQLGELLCVFF
jgi:hypothetical protein